LRSTAGKIIGFSLIGLGGADLLLGNTETPLPLVGQYLTQQLDAVMIGAGIIVLIFF